MDVPGRQKLKTMPEVLRNQTCEQNSAARTAALKRPHEYVKARNEYDEATHKNEERGKKFSDLDYHLSIMTKLTQDLQQNNEELDSEFNKVLWSQSRAKLTLASQQILHCEIIETMERHKAKARYAGNEYDSCGEIFGKRQVLTENIYSLKKELQAKKKETEQNEVQALKIERENLILRKRNHAMLVRLARQHQEAELRHQQTLDKLTILQERLKMNMGHGKKGN
jgi:transcription termination factor NusB